MLFFIRLWRIGAAVIHVQKTLVKLPGDVQLATESQLELFGYIHHSLKSSKHLFSFEVLESRGGIKVPNKISFLR